MKGALAALHAPVEPDLFTWFRRFFLGKFLLFEILGLLTDEKPSAIALFQAFIVGAGFTLSETRRWPRLGIAAILAWRLAKGALSFPYTINHAFFDAAPLALLAVSTHEEVGAPHPVRVAQAAILIVFFYAGVQKLVHGYYVDGQFLALKVLYAKEDMGHRMRWGLDVIRRIGGLAPLPPLPLPRPSWISGADAPLPGWVRGALQALSVTVCAAEVGLPLLALHQAARLWAAAGLLLLEMLILLLSGEISFGFTTAACLLAFFPRRARWRYPASFVALAVFAVLQRTS